MPRAAAAAAAAAAALPGAAGADLFEPAQFIATSGARDWNRLHHPGTGEPLFTLANARNGSAAARPLGAPLRPNGSAGGREYASTYNVDSYTYQWDSAHSRLFEVQSIPTHGAYRWEPFSIGADTFLVVANYYDGTRYDIDSVIYRWNGTAFVEFQRVRTSGASDWTPFAIGNDTFLAVANRRNGEQYDIDSVLYRWDPRSARFAEAQRIRTLGAVDWEHFAIDGDAFLAVANLFDGRTHDVESVVYRWNGSAFGEVQRIPTRGAHGWRHFAVGPRSFLAVANHCSDSSYSVDSVIYEWNGTAFVVAQRLPTAGAMSWEHFVMRGVDHLAVANQQDGATFDVDSVIYRWGAAGGAGAPLFDEAQRIRTSGAGDLLYFEDGNVSYLAVANERNDTTYYTDSVVYRSIPAASPHHAAHFLGEKGNAFAAAALLGVLIVLGPTVAMVRRRRALRERHRSEYTRLVRAANETYNSSYHSSFAADSDAPTLARGRVVRFADCDADCDTATDGCSREAAAADSTACGSGAAAVSVTVLPAGALDSPRLAPQRAAAAPLIDDHSSQRAASPRLFNDHSSVASTRSTRKLPGWCRGSSRTQSGTFRAPGPRRPEP